MSLKTKLLAAAAVLGLCLGVIAVDAQTAGKDARVAEPAAPAAPPAQSWILNCSNQGTGDTLTCNMVQTILARETNQRVISAAVFRDPQTKVLRLQLGLPHGLDLPQGVTLGIDDKPTIKNPIKTADQNGSYSLIDIDDAFLASLKAGQLLNVGVTSVDGREVTLQLSLAGFAASVGRV